MELKPLTLLVGANSSGKSSLLRLFPLLKQSVRTATRGPLLWYDNLVDFGSYRDAVRGHDEGREIAIEYRMELRQESQLIELMEQRDKQSPPSLELSICTQLSVADEGGTRHSACEIQCGDIAERFTIGADGAIVFGSTNASSHRQMRMVRTDQLLPVVGPTSVFTGITPNSDPVFAKLRAASARKSDELQSSLVADSLAFHTTDVVRRQLDASGFRLQKNLLRDAVFLSELRVLLLRRELVTLLEEANSQVTQFARKIAYVRPFRADPERSYRHKDLAVDVVDPTGANLAMFIRTLSDSARADLAEWTRRHFGFHVKATSSGGQVELRIVTEGGEEQNLVDMGYGYSQVLPVLVQLWLASREPDRSRRRRQTTVPVSAVCIEQPELHLHPAMQRRLGETLAGVVEAGRNVPADQRTPMFIETHSQSVITAIAYAVARGRVLPNEVQILFFDKSPGEDLTIRRVEISEKGSLSAEWPFGFLEP